MRRSPSKGWFGAHRKGLLFWEAARGDSPVLPPPVRSRWHHFDSRDARLAAQSLPSGPLYEETGEEVARTVVIRRKWNRSSQLSDDERISGSEVSFGGVGRANP